MRAPVFLPLFALIGLGVALLPTARPAAADGVVAIAAGSGHTCAVTSAGGAKCWGRNEYGELGDGTARTSSTPVDVEGLSDDVAAITTGGLHTCALIDDGGVKCWGNNLPGALGDGRACLPECLTPTDVCETYDADARRCFPHGRCPSPPLHPAEDDHGHGTHVRGIITSDGDNGLASVGVAPKANIFAWKVLDREGEDDFEGMGNALDKILYYYPGIFEFINMSLGTLDNYSVEACRAVLPAFQTTVHLLKQTGTLTFASSGNDGFKFGMSFPACIEDVVSVGAVYDLDYTGDIGNTFWGEAVCINAPPYNPALPDRVGCGSDSSEELDLVAPGVAILSDWPVGYGVASLKGTSMASPHAVGVAALLRQALPGVTVDDLLRVLKATGAEGLVLLQLNLHLRWWRAAS